MRSKDSKPVAGVDSVSALAVKWLTAVLIVHAAVGGRVFSGQRSNTYVDPPRDVQERFLDLRQITLADQDGATTHIVHEVAGIFDDRVLGFESIEYATFLDLDGDPNTGSAPAGLGFETEFIGAEFIVSVQLSPVMVESAPQRQRVRGSQAELPVMSTRTRSWRFDPDRAGFVELDTANIRTTLVPIVDVIDPIAPGGAASNELVGHSIDIVLPNSLRGPMADKPRLQVMSRGVQNGETVIDRLLDE